MRISRSCALSAVFLAGPALAAVRKEILNRNEPQPEALEARRETVVGSGYNPDAPPTTSLPTSSTESFRNSTTTSTTTSKSASTSTSSKVIIITSSAAQPPPNDPEKPCTGSGCVIIVTPTIPTSTITCVDTGKDAPKTIISTRYTTTTTFYGNSTDYTPPFPTLTPLPFCSDDTTATTPKLPAPSWSGPFPTPSSTRNLPVPAPGTTTFVTTEKNPKVIFETGPPPDYSSPRGPADEPGQHNTADPNGPSVPPVKGIPGEPKPKPKPSPQPSPKPTFSITAGPTKVIIGTSTIKGLKPDQSTTVIVDDETFTIIPTAVIGGGGTVEKPAPIEPSEWTPSPTMATIGGLPISASGSIIEIDGRTMTIPEDGITTKINGQDVTISPGQLKVGDEDLDWQVTELFNTDAVVAGGEMLTAIGSTIFVLNETTLTYGPDVSTSELTVDNDVITLAPEGIIVNNSTLGGPSASRGATTYAVVGGLTFTHIGSSLIVIDGHTFTVNDDSDDITTFVGGEMMTIGPDGVAIDSMTIGFDDGDMVTGTIKPGDKTGDDGPEETGSSEGGEDEDDVAGMVSPDALLLALFVGLSVWGL